ncbi:hypothetical protein M3Y99_00129100 [Aphelenchoides fujianensis]|nr:hypothetical protein M3Y99_00129100 [Aphelenchoides fujianensis]
MFSPLAAPLMPALFALLASLGRSAAAEFGDDACQRGLPTWAVVLISVVCTSIVNAIIGLICWWFRVKHKLKWQIIRRMCANFWICRRVGGYLKRKYVEQLEQMRTEISELRAENDDLKTQLDEALRELAALRPASAVASVCEEEGTEDGPIGASGLLNALLPGAAEPEE